MRAYLENTSTNPPANRVSWYRYAFPCYASLFLWVGFYQFLAEGTINRAPLGLIIFGFVVAGAAGYWLFYYVPAVMGMQTGYPLGVIGSSTFGSRGGQFVPGLLMAFLQAAWFGVAIYYAGELVLAGLGLDTVTSFPLFAAVAVTWGIVCAILSFGGIGLISRLAYLLGFIPALVLLAVAFHTRQGLPMHGLDLPERLPAFAYAIHLATGFFAVVAASAPSMGLHFESKADVRNNGLTGIWAPMVFAGTAAVIGVAGARALDPGLGSFGFIQAAQGSTGVLGPAIPWILLIASLPVALFFSHLATESFTVMLPGISKPLAVAAGGIVAILLAISGLPAQLSALVTALAAMAAPICGIMVADYWSHDKRWPHTRPGINYAGYGAWILGFLVGVMPLAPLPEHLLSLVHPAAVYSFAAGFVGYIVLGNIGLKPYRKHRRRRVPINPEERDGETDTVYKKSRRSHRSHDDHR